MEPNRWVRWSPGLAAVALSAAVVAVGSGCLPNPGGANRGARGPGSGRAGVEVGQGIELALSPDGEQLVYRRKGGLWQRSLSGGKESAVKTGERPGLLAFFGKGRGFFLKSRAERVGEGQFVEQVEAFADGASEAAWRATLPRSDGALVALGDGSGAALAGAEGVVVVERHNGQSRWALTPEGTPVDLVEVGSSLLLTESLPGVNERAPRRSLLRLLDEATGEVRCRLAVDNCADEVAVTKDGRRAFLAPTFCGADPVSVIDLDRCALAATLPGFGPVALAAGGRWAVAFADRDAADGGLLPLAVKNSGQRYHLLRIDPVTLAYEPIALGRRLPRYAATATGASLLVDTAQAPPIQVRWVDLERLTAEVVPGPAVPLSAYALTPDGRRAFLLSNGLYVLRNDPLVLSSMPLTFLPVALNITPDGKSLVLRDDEDRLHLLDTELLRARPLP